MLLNMFHGKIHRATVTEACLEYMGSITIDSELLELSGIIAGPSGYRSLIIIMAAAWKPMLLQGNAAAV